MTEPEVVELIARIGALWPSWRPPSDPEGFAVLVEEWTRELRHVEADHAVTVVRATARQGDRWPPQVGSVAAEARRRSSVPAAKKPPCKAGCVSGWVETDSTGQGSVRPCQTCRPQAHARWRELTTRPVEVRSAEPVRLADYRPDRTTEGGRHG